MRNSPPMEAPCPASRLWPGRSPAPLDHRDGLTRFLDDGRIEIDSNVVERQIRPIALGRRNALSAGSREGGRSWAILASLLNTAKLNQVDPAVYLGDVLARMVGGATPISRIAELLVWN